MFAQKTTKPPAAVARLKWPTRKPEEYRRLPTTLLIESGEEGCRGDQTSRSGSGWVLPSYSPRLR